MAFLVGGAGAMGAGSSLAASEAAAASRATTVTVTITDSLQPAHITISSGTTVTWRNADSDRHEIRSVSGPRQFETDDLEPGASDSIVFSTVGEYRYVDHRDERNPAYAGTITVRDQATPTTGTGPVPTTAPPPTTASVTMAGEQFRPGSVLIAVGGTVNWLNDDDRPHTVTGDSGGFDSGPMSARARFSHRFDTPGSFGYNCAFHSGMRGTINVVRPGSPPPPTTAPPGGSTTPTTAPPGTAPPTTATTAPPTTTPPARGTVAMQGSVFVPASVRIRPGGAVTWENRDEVMHTVTARDSSFDSSFMARSARWSHRFDAPGTYSYYCTLHPQMQGTVVVSSVGGANPAPGPGIGDAGPPGGGAGTGGNEPGVGAGSGDTSGAAGRAVISAVDNRFEPSAVTVGSGATVTFVNRGAAPHTATDREGRFSSGMIVSGDAYSVTLTAPGTYEYYCEYHDGMSGIVTVTTATADPSASVGTDDPGGGPAPVEGSVPRSGDRGGAGDSAPTEVAPTSVVVGDNFFTPTPARVEVGGVVVWSFDGALPHSVTADNGAFDSGIVASGAEFEHRFDKIGSLSYYCTVHPDMRGTIEVVAADGGEGGSIGGAAAAGSSTRGMLIGLGAGVALLLALAALFGATARFARGLERFDDQAASLAHRAREPGPLRAGTPAVE